ncbi:hypothetical protein ACJJTC_007789 [Scirpophaga incertulas]
MRDVIKALKNQNPTIFSDLGEGEEEIKIKYRRRARNPLTSHYILATSPGVWRKAVERGTLRIDLQQVRVEDQSPLIQCTRCLGFGHSKRFCREEVDLCRNCKKADVAQTEHNAFSQDCPTRKRWDEIARSAVAYC